MPTTSRASGKPPKRNTRHDIEPQLVHAQVESKVAYYERDRIRWKREAMLSVEQYEAAKIAGTAHRWARPPEGPAYVDPMIDASVAKEREYYALVRVIELPQAGKRFVLVYGDTDDSTVTRGTGPFESFDAAAGWFLRAGR